MGSLDIKSEPRILEPKHETGSNQSQQMLDTPTTSNTNIILELVSSSDSEEDDKNIFPSASPSSSVITTGSILEDSLQDSDTKNSGKVNEGAEYTSETPPIQVMERQTPPKYRIPSSVFARKQSGNQDWAMASNESLFSIQMSFNRQDSINWKSGDLERYTQEVETIPETGKSHGSETGETRGSEMGKNHELGEEGRTQNSLGDTSKIQESSIPDEPVKPDLQENQGHQKPYTRAPTWTNCFGCCTFCS